MSERVTIVSVPGMELTTNATTREEALDEFFRMARYQKEEAEKWLALDRNTIHVFRCNGPCAQRNPVDLLPESTQAGKDGTT